MGPPRILCDGMLGRLCRDLRILGYDVAWTDAADAVVLAHARDEDRVLLSRDAELVAGGRGVRIRSNDPHHQLLEAVAALGLRPEPDGFLTRCTVCNVLLAEGSAEGADLPAAARPPLSHCPDCGRTYWHGTHVETMRRRLSALWRS